MSTVIVLQLLYYFFAIIGLELFSSCDLLNCCKYVFLLRLKLFHKTWVILQRISNWVFLLPPPRTSCCPAWLLLHEQFPQFTRSSSDPVQADCGQQLVHHHGGDLTSHPDIWLLTPYILGSCNHHCPTACPAGYCPSSNTPSIGWRQVMTSCSHSGG